MAATAVASVSGPRAPVNPGRCALAFGPNDDGLCVWCGRPVPAHRTSWCSARCEATFDEAHLWPLAREAAYGRAAGRCVLCGPARGRAQIEVHHDPPVPPEVGYDPGCQHHPDRLTVLCRAHHQHEHRNLRAKPGTQLRLFAVAA